MAKNIVAYVGTESFDIILYLSRILQKMEHNVLVVDYSDTRAVTHSIPQISGVDTETECITYRHVDFTHRVIDLEISDKYDDILIDCGFSEPVIDLNLITRIVYVCNMFTFNMSRIEKLEHYDRLSTETALLIRDAVNTKLTMEYIISKIKKNVNADNISFLFWDDKDLENSLLCLYNQVFRFNHVSGSLKEYLLGEIKMIYPDMDRETIKTAYRRARKGE